MLLFAVALLTGAQAPAVDPLIGDWRRQFEQNSAPPSPRPVENGTYDEAERQRLIELDRGLESNTHWDDATRELAMNVSMSHNNLWAYCLSKEKMKYLASRETPENIAIAVLGECRDYRIPAQEAAARTMYGLISRADCYHNAVEMTNNFENGLREAIIAWVVKARLPSSPGQRIIRRNRRASK